MWGTFDVALTCPLSALLSSAPGQPDSATGGGEEPGGSQGQEEVQRGDINREMEPPGFLVPGHGHHHTPERSPISCCPRRSRPPPAA